ncbi:DUF5130 family protein [Nocardioides jishulii]|uniref:DUF5130 family protein n=1 Tax=Nocardioides jishulii TaxID=2575440 RepID=A0A4U2YJU3_9ACTN|nr:DUF5130 family protein [Nocardioides jishulii]TKI61389.1 DUF5130 family protein [Nocardioides jishulii]
MPVAPVASGELSARERADLDKVIRAAEQASRVEFSLFRGVSEGDPKAFAQSLHASLAAPDRSVLIMVDPLRRVVEVVTGADVRRTLTDAEAGLAVVAMQTAFAEGDEVGGLKRGINLLAEHARAPRSNHTA